MKINYDPYRNDDVGDALIEGWYQNNSQRQDWVHTGSHLVILRSQLGIVRGEIDSLTLRVFDYDNEKAHLFEADKYGRFPGDWYDYIEDHTMEWVVEWSKTELKMRKEDREKAK